MMSESHIVYIPESESGASVVSDRTIDQVLKISDNLAKRALGFAYEARQLSPEGMINGVPIYHTEIEPDGEIASAEFIHPSIANDYLKVRAQDTHRYHPKNRTSRSIVLGSSEKGQNVLSFREDGVDIIKSGDPFGYSKLVVRNGENNSIELTGTSLELRDFTEAEIRSLAAASLWVIRNKLAILNSKSEK